MPNWKTSLVAALTKTALGVERMVRPLRRADPNDADRVLVLQFPTTLGCMVLETPIFEALRRCRPGRKIAVATYGLGLQVLRHSPYVDELIEAPHPAEDLRGAVRVLRHELRVRGFRPQAVLTAAFDRQRAITRLAVLAGRAWRGGFAEELWMYDAGLRFDPGVSVLENNLRVPALLGCDGGGLQPRVFFTRQDADIAEKVFATARQRGRPVMTVVVAGNSGPGWHEDRFLEVIRYAWQALGYEVFLTGTTREAAAIEALRLRAGASLELMDSIAGQTALFALSDLVLTVDTGPMHMARGTGTPLIVLAGCWERPYVWLPVGLPQVKIVQGPYDPQPGEDYRMDDISAADVMGALDEMARRFPADEAARAARVAASFSEVSRRR